MSDSALLRQTERFFHEQIPLARAMGVTVEHWDGNRLVLAAPLDANHNHLGTAFGGSLGALATLAGYGLLWLLLDDRESHIVIRDSAIRFLRPVTGTLRAVCERPDETSLAAFRTRFRETGKARLRLRAFIGEADQPAVLFSATYVALGPGTAALR